MISKKLQYSLEDFMSTFKLKMRQAWGNLKLSVMSNKRALLIGFILGVVATTIIT